MGSSNSRNWPAPECPGCGKPDAARMNSSRWRHNVSCCGDECGFRVGEALKRAHDSDPYKFFEAMLTHAREQIRLIELAEIDEARIEHGIQNATPRIGESGS